MTPDLLLVRLPDAKSLLKISVMITRESSPNKASGWSSSFPPAFGASVMASSFFLHWDLKLDDGTLHPSLVRIRKSTIHRKLVRRTKVWQRSSPQLRRAFWRPVPAVFPRPLRLRPHRAPQRLLQLLSRLLLRFPHFLLPRRTRAAWSILAALVVLATLLDTNYVRDLTWPSPILSCAEGSNRQAFFRRR